MRSTHLPPIGRVVAGMVLVALVVGVALLGRAVAFHVLPVRVTGEAIRLAQLLQPAPGKTFAEIGAGSGWLSVAMASRLEPGGVLYATELDPGRRREIQERTARERVRNVVVVEAGETSTGLPDACCDAIFMRNVYHHIGDPARFNRSLRRSLRPGGLLAIIDFAPGAFWHLGRPPDSAAATRTGHGVGPRVVAHELEQEAFVVEQIVDDWGGGLYLVLLRAPRVSS